jgi:hypothetical protein
MSTAEMPKESLHDDVIERIGAPASDEKEVCDGHASLDQFKNWLKNDEQGLAVQEAMIPDNLLRQRRTRSSVIRVQFRMRHLRLK